MKVFLSWSGNQSKAVAQAFNDWLPTIINAIDPWLSSESLSKGIPWISGIKSALAESNGVGLFFLTSEAISSPWMLFEAGSISALGHERVCTVFVDVLPESLKPPFSLFQGTKLERDDVEKLVSQLNFLTPTPLSTKALKASFDRGWRELESDLIKAREIKAHSTQPGKITTEKYLIDIRQAVSRIESRLGSLEESQASSAGALSQFYVGEASAAENLGMGLRIPGIINSAMKAGLLSNVDPSTLPSKEIEQKNANRFAGLVSKPKVQSHKKS